MTRTAAMRELSRRAGRSGETIGFVPTMGALHDGHLCDWLFMPQARTLYPPGFATSVSPGPMGNLWEGAVRPDHFTGVLTIVMKLLEIVRPDTIYLGQKDAQQVAVIGAMVRDLDLPIRIVVHPTVRERDGLAMSSRNMYLSHDERARAAGLARALRAGKRVARSRRDARAILAEARRTLRSEARPDSIDYLALVDPRSFEPISRLSGRGLLIAAIRVGRTRLIDNMPVASAREED